MSAPGLTSREIALAIVPHVTGGLSMLGSAFIAYTVLSSKQKRQKTYHRLLVAMSLSDIVSSFSYFLSTWPIPQGPVGGWNKYGGSPYHYAAVGNDATCTAQGFGIQFGIMTTAAYNVMLAVHYLLTIRWNYSERKLKSVEPYMLTVPPVFGLGLSLPQIFLKYYNDTNLWCWIKASWEYEDAVQRSYNARWGFAYGPLWAIIFFITAAQVYLWWTVRKTERRMLKFHSFSTAKEQTRHSRRVAQQAALYVGAFYVTNLPYTTIAATQRFYNPHTTDGFFALLAVVLCAPLQGALNVIVYRRAQIVKVAEETAVRISARLSTVRKTFLADNNNAGKMGLAGDCEEGTNNGVESNVEEAKGHGEDCESRQHGEDGESRPPPGEHDHLIASHVEEVYED